MKKKARQVPRQSAPASSATTETTRSLTSDQRAGLEAVVRNLRELLLKCSHGMVLPEVKQFICEKILVDSSSGLFAVSELFQKPGRIHQQYAQDVEPEPGYEAPVSSIRDEIGEVVFASIPFAMQLAGKLPPESVGFRSAFPDGGTTEFLQVKSLQTLESVAKWLELALSAGKKPIRLGVSFEMAAKFYANAEGDLDDWEKFVRRWQKAPFGGHLKPWEPGTRQYFSPDAMAAGIMKREEFDAGKLPALIEGLTNISTPVPEG